jgi:hypothetical protein
VFPVTQSAFTELTPADAQGRPITRHVGKAIDANGVITAAPNHVWWRHQAIHLSSVVFLHRYLIDAQRRGVALIRGLPASDRQPMRRWLAHRESRGDHGFIDGPGVTGIAMDIDGAQLGPAEDWITDPDGAVDSIVRRLPEPWCETSYCWMFTATHGLIRDADKRWTGEVNGNTLRARIFWLAERPIAGTELEPWFKILKAEDLPAIDEALGRAVQPCYLTRPKWLPYPDRDPLGLIKTAGLIRREYDKLRIPDDLPKKLRWARATGAAGGPVVQHPDAITAIRAIGTPTDGSKRGDIHAHLKAAVFLLVRANPRKPDVDLAAQAEDIAATIRHEVRFNYEEINENLQTYGRRWEDLNKYLRDDTLKRLAIWLLEHVNRPRHKHGEGRHKRLKRLLSAFPQVLSMPLEVTRQRIRLMAFNFFVIDVYGSLISNQTRSKDQQLPPLCRTLFAGVGIGKSRYMRAAIANLCQLIGLCRDQQQSPDRRIRSATPSAQRRTARNVLAGAW